MRESLQRLGIIPVQLQGMPAAPWRIRRTCGWPYDPESGRSLASGTRSGCRLDGTARSLSAMI